MKNYTITVNGNVYDVVVEEGAGSGAVAAPVAPKAAPKAAPAAPAAAGRSRPGAPGPGSAGSRYNFFRQTERRSALPG